MLIKKIPDASGLVIKTVLNIKISTVENKILDTSGLETAVVIDTKINELRIKFLIMLNILLLLNLIS